MAHVRSFNDGVIIASRVREHNGERALVACLTRLGHRAEVSSWSLGALPAAIVCWLVLVPTPSLAQPMVVVRAEARIELRAEHQGNEITISGTLVDDLGEPLARRSVVVAIHRPDGRTVRTARQTTDGEGGFVLTVAGEAGRYTLTASYEGDEYHPRLSVERQADLTRAPTRLALEVGDGALDLDVSSHPLVVRATSREGGAGLPIVLMDELGRTIGNGVTDTDGELRLSLESGALGEPGTGRLVARTDGDARRAEARVETPIVRYRRATLVLEASRDSIGPEGEVVLSGRLTTVSGPLASEAIGLFVGSEHLDTALTGPDGRFEVTTDAPSLGRGLVTVLARFESDGPGVPATESEPLTIEVRSGARSIWGWLALPLLLSLLLLGWLRRKAPPTEVPAPQEPEPIGVIARSASRRSPPKRWVSGRLEDVRGQPLRGRVRAIALDGEGEALAECDDDGGFRFELRDGRWRILFEAPRHAPAESEVDIPHRGSLEGLRVRLETWRARALAVLRGRFTAKGRSLDRWAKTTVHSLRDDAELADTAAEVEVSYYGPIEPDARRIAKLRGEGPTPP